MDFGVIIRRATSRHRGADPERVADLHHDRRD
jgi:hypothetical protein